MAATLPIGRRAGDVAEMQLKLTRLMQQAGVPFRISFIPVGKPNRSGRELVDFPPANANGHETANVKAGANAVMHERFCHNGGGTEHVSFTFVVDGGKKGDPNDKGEVVQLLPLNEVGWQAADGLGPGNTNSWSAEFCVNVDGDWERCKHNAAVLFACLRQLAPNIKYKQHGDYKSPKYPNGKDCPHVLRLNGGKEWKELLAEVEKIASGAQPNPPTPNTEFFTQTGHNLSNAFRTYWYENNGLVYFGFPKSEEIYNVRLEDGKLWTIQFFERGVLQYRDPEGVHIVRLAALVYDKGLAAQVGLAA